jgi:L-amino acid N-acyltransferase YncA
MAIALRLAEIADAAAIQAIYAPIVRDTIISFELEVPTIAEVAQRITKTLPQHPWLVATEHETVVGYAYASRHRERAAYQWAVDVSCYVHPDRRGQGLGRGLYTELFRRLVNQGYYHTFAGIALPNTASVALHEAMGMRPLGVYRQVGYKLGAWHDVGWWQGELQPLSEVPQPPRPVQTSDISG